MPKLNILRAMLATLALALVGSVKAAIISVGTYPAVSQPPYTIPAGTFLVPVEISGAVNLQSWQFDLNFDNTVVEVIDPFDGSSGLYAAEFTPGDASSLSFILGGFPFNIFGLVDDLAGSHPALLSGATGDGVLAYVLFGFLPGQETGNPGLRVTDPVITQQVPESARISLLALGLLLLAAQRRLRSSAAQRID